MVSRLLITLSAGLLFAVPAEPRVEVSEAGGVYQVSAAFAVAEPPQSVMAVLSDFERIPKFVPGMEISRVVERHGDDLVVEQQATSRFMMFSKRVHLLLDVHRSDESLRFRDKCGQSFSIYDGAWALSQHDALTVVDYSLRAKPTFDVPAFVLKRLLKRDSIDLIERIKAEIGARANRRE